MVSDQISALSGDEKSSRGFWFHYAPYWPLFLCLLLLFLAGAWVYLLFTPQVYESNAALIIKDSKRGIEDSKIIGELNQLTAPTIVENEMEVFKSRALMRDVVQNLKLYAPVYYETKYGPRSAYVNSPLLVEAQSPEFLGNLRKIYIRYDPSNKQAIIQHRAYRLDQWEKTPYGTLRFTINRTGKLIQEPLYFSLVNPKIIIAELLNKLDVSSNKLSSVVNLKMLDEIPKRSEDILNELILAYNRATLHDKNILAANTLSFFEERLEYISRDLDSIEARLQQYRSSRGAIDIGQQGKLFLENVSQNDRSLSDVNMKLAVLDQVEKYIYSKENQGGLVPSTLGIDDILLSSLLTKLYDLELQYEKIKRTTGINNPEVSLIADQIQKMKPSILENIRSQKQGLEATKRNLFSTNKEYSAQLETLPLQERNLVEISREQNIKTSIYNYLLQKREEAALSHSGTSDTRLIDKAESSFRPVSPQQDMIYILAVGLAFAAGVLIISLRKFFNRTVMFRHEIEKLTSFPIIAEIGRSKGRFPLVIQKGKTTFIAEQFRKLRASLGYMGIGSKRRKLLITSTISGEGKSFLTANLGLSLANTGKKVVIVEFDLSNPTLTKKVGCEGGKGIADYLSGHVDPDEMIIPVPANENLFLVPAGTLPADPSDLIINNRVGKLFNYLENIFDYVLVDSAPVGVLSDAYVLSKYCDATLYVVRHGFTPKVMLERLDENNKINELKSLALVFNGVSARGIGRVYGYGYGYGYGYIGKRAGGSSRRGPAKANNV